MPTLKNPHHELFAHLMLESQGTGTPAHECAIWAGYSKTRARQTASRLMANPHIRARIAELSEGAAPGVMSVRERMERLSEISRARLTDFVSKDGKVVVKPWSKNVGAIKSIERKTQKINGVVTEKIEIKLHNPARALRELKKMERVYGKVPPYPGSDRS